MVYNNYTIQYVLITHEWIIPVNNMQTFTNNIETTYNCCLLSLTRSYLAHFHCLGTTFHKHTWLKMYVIFKDLKKEERHLNFTSHFFWKFYPYIRTYIIYVYIHIYLYTATWKLLTFSILSQHHNIESALF